MQEYQRKFIELCLRSKVLRFGDFELKSGRHSPYFFNAGNVCDGAALSELSRYYAEAIMATGWDIDVLFGPAYKGIPLVSSTAIALADHHQRNYPFCYNRKEAKDHGEGGQMVGAPLSGNVLIIDDVITAGTAINESMQYVNAANANLAGIMVALDRQEKGSGTSSATQEVATRFDTQVSSIITLDHLIEYLQEHAAVEYHLTRLLAYREQYGI